MKNENIRVIKINLSGVNLNRIFGESKKNNINLYDITRKDYKNITLNIDVKNLSKIKKIAKSQNYKLEIIKDYGFQKYLHIFFTRIGILLGAITFVVISILYSFFIWSIQIYGNQRISSQKIINVLKQNKIFVGSIYSQKNVEKIETLLVNTFDDISLCSVIKKGTSIIVNIKEKLYSDELDDLYNGKDIIASDNMTITSINVIQGTALKQSGDSVKKGETIVAGYFFGVDNKKVNCKANASINAITWKSHTEIYLKNQERFVRTGKKQIESYLELFGTKFNVKNSKEQFEYFDVEEKNNVLFKNNFLPFHLVTKTYYQTKKESFVANFDADKESLLKKCQQIAYSKITNTDVISKTFDTISETPDSFVVTSYVEIKIEF